MKKEKANFHSQRDGLFFPSARGRRKEHFVVLIARDWKQMSNHRCCAGDGNPQRRCKNAPDAEKRQDDYRRLFHRADLRFVGINI